MPSNSLVLRLRDFNGSGDKDQAPSGQEAEAATGAMPWTRSRRKRAAAARGAPPRAKRSHGARAFPELQAEQRRGQFQESWRELQALVPAFGGDVAQLTTVTPGFDGSDAAPLAALQLAVRTWRAVGVLRAVVQQNPDGFDAFTAAQLPRAECPLAHQPVNFFAVVLASGFLLRGIGRVAACCRFMGGRRGGALWEQRAGVSLCEAVMRELCGPLDAPGSTRVVCTRLCLSVGRLLLRLASRLPLAPHILQRTLQGHTSSVYALAACPGGKLASASSDDTIKIWNVATGQCERTLRGPPTLGGALAACAGGKLASGSYDKTIRIWDVAAWKCERTLRRHTCAVRALAACPGGKLASGSQDKSIIIWDLAKAEGEQFELQLGGHTGWVVALAACAGNKLASGSYDWTIRIWDVATGRCERTLKGHGKESAPPPDPNRDGSMDFYSACPDSPPVYGSAEYFDLNGYGDSSFCETRGEVLALAACAGGKLASGSADTTIKIWDVATGQCERTLQGHTDRVRALVACAEGKLASSSDDGRIKIWDVATGLCERTLQGHTAAVLALARWGPDELASGSCDDTIKVWGVKP